jgi:Bacterial PH domain
MRNTDTVLFQSRPRKVRVLAGIGAAVLLAVFTVVAVLLRQSSTGVYFYTSDQVAMIGLGVLMAMGALLFARPRVRATRSGVEVRNMVGTRAYPWDLVEQVSFPDGSAWARLEMPDDEYVPVLAIQAIDGERAVTAMRELRWLHREVSSGALPGQTVLPGKEMPAEPGPDEYRDDARGTRADQVGDRLGDGGDAAAAHMGDQHRGGEHGQ